MNKPRTKVQLEKEWGTPRYLEAMCKVTDFLRLRSYGTVSK